MLIWPQLNYSQSPRGSISVLCLGHRGGPKARNFLYMGTSKPQDLHLARGLGERFDKRVEMCKPPWGYGPSWADNSANLTFSAGPAPALLIGPIMPRLKAIFLNSLPCLCSQSSTAWTSSCTNVSKTRTGSSNAGETNIWLLSCTLLLRDQHCPIWCLLPVLAKPHETWQLTGMMCCFSLKMGRSNSTAASNQASRVVWFVMAHW